MEAKAGKEVAPQKMRINMALQRLAIPIPELRVGQLVCNAVASWRPEIPNERNLYYIEDKDLAVALESYEPKGAR